MDIREVKTAKKVGKFELKDKKQEEWGKNYIIKFIPELYENNTIDKHHITKKEYEDDIPRVYLIVVDNIIKKIGGSSGKGGIKTTISFYENAAQGSPGPVRFVIHQLIGKELEEKHNVEIYMITSPKVEAEVSGLFKKFKTEIASFKEMEDRCKLDYVIFTLKKFLNSQKNNMENNKEIQNTINKLNNIVKSLENLDRDFEKLKEFIFNCSVENTEQYLQQIKDKAKEINNYFFKSTFNKVDEKNDDPEKIKDFLYLKLRNKYNNVLSKPKSALKIQLKNLQKYIGIELKIFPDWNFQENNEPYPNSIYQEYLEYHKKRTNS